MHIYKIVHLYLVLVVDLFILNFLRRNDGWSAKKDENGHVKLEKEHPENCSNMKVEAPDQPAHTVPKFPYFQCSPTKSKKTRTRDIASVYSQTKLSPDDNYF